MASQESSHANARKLIIDAPHRLVAGGPSGQGVCREYDILRDLGFGYGVRIFRSNLSCGGEVKIMARCRRLNAWYDLSKTSV
jgi:hypothetical protein